MVLVKTDAFDVIPRVGLMAAIALVDLHISATRIARSVRFTGNRLVNHFKVHHVMARRRLVTLGAGLRDGRWVSEFRDRPLRRAVAWRAVGAEQTAMPVFRLVACCAVEQRFFSEQLWRGGSSCVAWLRERILELLDARGVIGILLARFFKILQADAPQRDMIHFG